MALTNSIEIIPTDQVAKFMLMAEKMESTLVELATENRKLTDGSRMLTIAEIAERWGYEPRLARKYLHQYAKVHKIKAYRFGNDARGDRYRLQDIELLETKLKIS